MEVSFVDEGVKLISYCPLCEASYEPRQATEIGENRDSHLLHIECGNCQNAIIAAVTITAVVVASVGMVTDLAADEVSRFHGTPPLPLTTWLMPSCSSKTIKPSPSLSPSMGKSSRCAMLIS